MGGGASVDLCCNSLTIALSLPSAPVVRSRCVGQLGLLAAAMGAKPNPLDQGAEQSDSISAEALPPAGSGPGRLTGGIDQQSAL